MDLKRKISDGPLPPHLYKFANQPQALEQIAMTAFTLTKDLGLPSKKMKKMLRDLLAKNTFYGSYYELGVYRWLNCNGVHYVPQPLVSQSDVLCQTGDVDLDGRFKFVDIYFDIKSFGFQYNLKERLRTCLQDEENLSVSIDGPMDHALRDIQTYALEDRGNYQTLVKNLRATGTGEIRKLDWKIKVIEVPINFATTFENSTRSAKKNRHYPFNFAKQFTRNAPFLLIFAFDHLFSKTIHVNFANCSSTLFRSLCRRAFVQFKADKNAINSIGKRLCEKD